MKFVNGMFEYKFMKLYMNMIDSLFHLMNIQDI